MAFKDDEERRAYFREYNKGWYQRHKERLLEKRRQHNEELRQWIKQYKSKLRCVECGENHPACLQFHHRNREDKSFGVGGIVGRTHTSIKRLEREISKCEVLCGNCHAMRHWRETHDFDDWREVLPLRLSTQEKPCHIRTKKKRKSIKKDGIRDTRMR